jgi:hypothetical protein
VTGALLALALAGTLALAAAPPLAQEEWEAPPYEEEDEENVKHLFLSVWGGEAFGLGGEGTSADVLSAEVAWAFGHLDVGLAGYGYRDLSPDAAWTRVAMLRLTQRFPMRSGVEAAFGLGIGAARDSDWSAWFQVALGVRVPLGPLFLGGELAFERGDLLRLSAGLGLAF